jgi:hypothetical protein
MCHKLESSFVLVHNLKEKDSCRITDLVQLKRKIEAQLPSVFVDVSRKSILNSISCYPEIFQWENDRIKRKSHSEKFFCKPLIDFFDNNIDSTIKKQILPLIENAKE